MIERLQSGRIGRLIRFGAVSAVSIVISQLSLAILFGVLRMGARPANIAAACIATLPAFQLSRRWVWQKSGPSHLTREVMPFWLMALLGLAFSTWAAGAMETWAMHHLHTHLARTIAVMIASLGSYGVLWLVRFFVLDHLVFHAHGSALSAHREASGDPVHGSSLIAHRDAAGDPSPSRGD